MGDLNHGAHYVDSKFNYSTPTYRLCNDENESSEHILGTCDILMHFKKKYLGAYSFLGGLLSLVTSNSLNNFREIAKNINKINFLYFLYKKINSYKQS